jgi:hypothetical protein
VRGIHTHKVAVSRTVFFFTGIKKFAVSPMFASGMYRHPAQQQQQTPMNYNPGSPQRRVGPMLPMSSVHPYATNALGQPPAASTAIRRLPLSTAADGQLPNNSGQEAAVAPNPFLMTANSRPQQQSLPAFLQPQPAAGMDLGYGPPQHQQQNAQLFGMVNPQHQHQMQATVARTNEEAVADPYGKKQENGSFLLLITF